MNKSNKLNKLRNCQRPTQITNKLIIDLTMMLMMNILKTAKNLLQKISQPFESLALLGVFLNSIIKASDIMFIAITNSIKEIRIIKQACNKNNILNINLKILLGKF